MKAWNAYRMHLSQTLFVGGSMGELADVVMDIIRIDSNVDHRDADNILQHDLNKARIRSFNALLLM